jgi:hypothetical protein
MPYVDRPLPEGLELPKLRSEKSLANLKLGGRLPGSINRISKDLKSGILNGAIAHGYDGEGAGGLDGYLQMCATKYPKHYMHLLGKLLPLQVGDGLTGQRIGTINIVSVPEGRYLSEEDIAKTRAPSFIEHDSQPQYLEPEHFQSVPIESEPEPVDCAPEPQAPRYVPLPPRPHKVY